MKPITATELFDLLPVKLLDDLIKTTGIDYKVQKLTGKNMFSLLLYGLLEEDRMSLRTLEDTFNGSKFKFFFDIERNTVTKYNSLSDRLSTMPVEYFVQIHQAVYDRLCLYYPLEKRKKYQINRIDSTMVSEQARKLHQGMSTGRKKDGKKQVKYTLNLTDIFPSSVEVFTSQSALNEDVTMPITIYQSLAKCIDTTQDNVFVFDRGLCSNKTKERFDNDGIKFVTRMRKSAKYEVLEDLTIPINRVNNLIITHYQLIRLNNTQTTLKLIRAINDDGKELFFISNLMDEDIQTIIDIYRKRWEIEVFFRFLKQELNLSHLVSMNENGITIILYMTMILSMLILIYKKINQLGYKTAKRRFKIQLDEYITALIVEACGGDSSKWVYG
jgi:Transposase DDE domain